MRILFLTINPFSQFVTYKRALGMGEQLARGGHEVFIVAEDCSENRMRMKLEAPHCLPLWRKRSGRLMELVRTLKFVYQVRPEYLYASVFSVRCLGGLGFLCPKGTKLVLEFCELYSSIKEHSFRWRYLEWLAEHCNDMFVCASRYLEKDLKNRISKTGCKKPTIYLPYGYPGYLAVRERPKKACKRILFMASIWRGYGVFEVMAAVAKVRSEGFDVRLDVIGKGPALGEARQWVLERKLDDEIVLHGYVAEDELDEYMSCADVFISPMHDTVQDWARCPSKLYYYLPYNKPIVTCRIGDPYDTLGDLGYYYEPDDVPDMARALIRALNDSDRFEYPKDFLARHSWDARAVDFVNWLSLAENEK